MSRSMTTLTPRTRIHCLLALATLAIASTASSSAFADAAAGAPAQGCFVTGLPNKTSLPANAPGFILTDNSQGATATVSAELVTGDTRTALVGPVKDAHGLNVILFSSTPAPAVGTHTISTKVACSNDNNNNNNNNSNPNPDTTVMLTDPVPFPTTVGTLTVQPSSPPTGNDEVLLEASPNLRPFFPVAVMKLTVNNDVTTATGGSMDSAKTTVTFRAHTGSACVENGALHREKRIVKVNIAADIAGLADSPAPATIDIPVDCGAIRWTSENDFKSPKDSSGNTTTTTPTTSSSPSTASSSNGDAAGCALAARSGSGPKTSPSNAISLLVVGALTLLGLRRRRRCHRRRRSA
jgi:hypothetical protein